MNTSLRSYFELLGRYLRSTHQRRRFALLAFLLGGGILLQLIVPQFTRVMIDTATGAPDAPLDDDGSLLVIMAVAFIGLTLFQQVVSVLATYVGEQVGWTATNQLRSDLFDHALHLDMNFHGGMPPGTLIERIDSDVSQLADFFSQFFIRIIGSLVLTIGILAALFLEDWRIGAVFTLYTVFSFLMLYRFRNIAISPQKAYQEAVAQLSGFFADQLSGIEDLRANGATGYAIHGLLYLQGIIRQQMMRFAQSQALLGAVIGLIVTLGYVVAFLSGYFLYTNALITVGVVYLIMNYMVLLNRPLNELSQRVENLQTIGASVERVHELFAAQSQTPEPESEQTQAIPPGSLGVGFSHVNFNYRADTPTLQDVTFRLAAGKKLGLVGRTGSGKTTIARLILRLYLPQAGQITLNGIDLKHVTSEEARQRIATVTQDVQLFDGSIRDNLTFFRDEIEDARILEALERLELGNWLRRMPDGLNTRLEAGGRSLSAGEGQLLACARAFLRQPDLVILDEASSRLDPATEAQVSRALDHLLTPCTGVIIAHRLATLRRVDQVLILDSGEVVEFGERKVLEQDPTSRYFHLLQIGDEALA